MLRARAFGFGRFGGIERPIRLLRHLGESEVENLGRATLGDENICRLDVAVHDAFGMRRIQGVGDIDPNGQ
jgi:hypothetical protein